MTTLQKYENAFADMVGAHAARATTLGRQALVILLKAVGVQQGDKVGVCAFTCLSVIEAVKVAGAEPYYLDIDESQCISPESINKVEKNFLQVVVLQHTFGNPGKLDQLLESCKRINAIVIEDCAHALGCFWKGRPLGQFGQGAIYSFQWGKPFTTGEGGMLTVNSDNLLSKVDEIINDYSMKQSFLKSLAYELQRTLFRILNGTRLEIKLRYLYRMLRKKHKSAKIFDNYNWDFRKGYIQRPNWLTIRAGMREIKNWPDNMKMRRHNTEIIEQRMKENNIPLWPEQLEADITYLRYPIRTSSKAELLNRALAQSLDLAGWYCSPVHPLCGDNLKKIGYFPGMAVHSEESIKRIVHLPTGKGITPRKLDTIMKMLIAETNKRGA